MPAVCAARLPHGRIVKLDVAPALAVPGVRAVITSEDFFEHGLYGFPVKDKYMLAYEKVRYVGEAIAAVAADTPEAALAGVQAIICELEPLPGVFDPDARAGPRRAAGRPRPAGRQASQLPRSADRAQGRSAGRDRAQSPVKLDERYSVGPQEHAYIEPEGVLAVPTREGGVVVYAPNQSPFVNHGNLAMVLDLPHNLVRIIQPPVGGSFGGKDDIIYESSAQAGEAGAGDRPARAHDLQPRREPDRQLQARPDAHAHPSGRRPRRHAARLQVRGAAGFGRVRLREHLHRLARQHPRDGRVQVRRLRRGHPVRLHQQRLLRRVPRLRQHRGLLGHRAGH